MLVFYRMISRDLQMKRYNIFIIFSFLWLLYMTLIFLLLLLLIFVDIFNSFVIFTDFCLNLYTMTTRMLFDKVKISYWKRTNTLLKMSNQKVKMSRASIYLLVLVTINMPLAPMLIKCKCPVPVYLFALVTINMPLGPMLMVLNNLYMNLNTS